MTDIILIALQSLRVLVIGVGLDAIVLTIILGSILTYDEYKIYQREWCPQNSSNENDVRHHRAPRKIRVKRPVWTQDMEAAWADHYMQELKTLVDNDPFANKSSENPSLHRYMRLSEEYANA